MPPQPVTRRDLARVLAAGTATALVGTTSARTDDEATQSPAEPVSPVDMQMSWLLEKYPNDQLTAEQREEIRRIVQSRISQSALLRAYPLNPSDTPALVFAAWRAED